MQVAGLPAPVFENRRNEFVVTLYNGRQDDGHGAKDAKIAEHPADYTAAQAALQREDRNKERTAASLLSYCQVPRSRQEIADLLGVRTIFYVTRHYLRPLIASGALRMTMPDKPASKKQKYVATA